MKSQAIILALLAALLSACSPRISMPAERPADLRVSYYKGGGMQPESESCTVTQDSVVHETMYDMLQNRWRCTPTAEEMDQLWAELVRLDAVNIRTEDRGMVYDRGGVTLHMAFGETDVEIIDGGTMYLLDEERFSQTTAAIYRCTNACTNQLAVPVEISLQLQTDNALVESYSVGLSLMGIFDMRENADPESPKPFIQKMLPGHYMLNAMALVDSQFVSLHQPIDISPEKHSYQIVLKSDTFELHQ
jgi:hypothetical protein